MSKELRNGKILRQLAGGCGAAPPPSRYYFYVEREARDITRAETQRKCLGFI